MELGLHIADFTWSGGAPVLGRTLASHARNAEAAGITRITVMDHFWQLRGIGPVEHEMLEAYAALSFLAAHTERVQLHALVTGVIYREPALLAKQVTTLDVLSEGRAGLGIGAAWNVEESEGLGFRFPPVAERFERLEETIQICLQMWSDSEAPFDGKHYHLGRTLNSPQSLQRPRPYLMIGGGGEEDPAARRHVRRRLQHLREPRGRPQAGRAQAALRGRRPGLRTGREDDHDHHRPGHDQRRHRPHRLGPA